MATPLELPIIDLVKAQTNKEEYAKMVIDGLENIGFLYIDNIDLDFDKMHKACEWLFNQPDHIKNAIARKHWKPENKNVYRGYFPVVPGEPSRKEGFEFAKIDKNDQALHPDNWFYEPSVWPEEDGKFPFQKFLHECYEIFFEASLQILRLVAKGLGLEEHAFDEIFADKPLSTLRIIHYPSWNGKCPEIANIEDKKVVVTPDHTDSNFLTLLATFDYEGLEVVAGDGQWHPVPPRPKSVVMNIGDVFSRMMGGRFKATRHRVLDIGRQRYSFPFFHEPGFSGDIGLNWMNKYTGKGPEHKPERYGPWLLHQIKYVKKYAEYRVLPDVE